MKIQLTVEYDGTEAQCDELLTELETVVEDNEGVILTTGGGTAVVDLIQVVQPAAVGREKGGS